MDKRGLTVDPNRDSCTATRWFEEIGPTQKPSPYATRSWVCHQKYEVVVVTKCKKEVRLVFDNGSDFQTWLYEFILNGGTLGEVGLIPPTDVYDGGGFDNQGDPCLESSEFIKHYFASVKVYDSLASSPGQLPLPVDISRNSIYDNGDDFQNPIPNPEAIYDGGLFEDWGLGITLEGGQWWWREGIDCNTIIVDPSDKDDPPGDLLGEINYEMVDCQIFITDWSHYNWMDDTPVRKAFRCLVNSRPDQVSDIFVRDSPHAFWTSLGFETQVKGDDVLVYNDVYAHKNY